MIENHRNNCTGCRACEKICPKNAIEMIKDNRGFLYPVVNHDKCIKCGICEKRCPINNKEVEKNKIAYAAYNKNEEVRMKSSSGGIFTALAKFVLKNNGVIFGAAFNKEFMVEHICVENEEELSRLRSSKYIQSDVNKTFEKAKEFLELGKLVYFSGTPCQIEGLKAYLLKEYDNLITQDVICHGVPSPKVWMAYLKYKNKRIQACNFRDKEKTSWGKYQVKFVYEDGIEYTNHDEDIFMKLFLGDLILRESCYQCKFKKLNRISDFTLADFWGISNIDKSFNDGKGTSLVIVNSKKGQEIFDKISNEIEKKKVELNQAIQYNTSMIQSVSKPKNFEKISELIEKEEFEKIFRGEYHE